MNHFNVGDLVELDANRPDFLQNLGQAETRLRNKVFLVTEVPCVDVITIQERGSSKEPFTHYYRLFKKVGA